MPSSLVRAAVVVAFAASVLCGCGGTSSKASVSSIEFTAADGTATSVASFKGTPLVINLWATYCGPCVKEMPAIDSVAAAVTGQVQIIGVNVFDSPQDAAAFAKDRGVSYPQFTDPDGALSTALNVTGLPATAFFDEDGTLLEVHAGPYTADSLRAAIAAHFPTVQGSSS